MLPEHKNWLNDKRTKVIAGVAILATCFVGGYLASESNKAKPNQTVATDTIKSGETQKQPSIPNEAKSFVTEFGNRYPDPVSTYFADKAFKKNPTSALPVNYLCQNEYDIYAKEHANTSLIMTDDYINNYKKPRQQGTVSPHGFVWYELPLNAPLNEETAVRVFNEYTKPMMDNYLNYIAKNTTSAGRAIIDEEFLSYCSNTDSANAFKYDDDGINILMNTAKAIVAKYGSAANYSVAPASIGYYSDNPKNTIFLAGINPMVNEGLWNKEPIKSCDQPGVLLVVNIDKYTGQDVVHATEIIEDVQISFWEQPAWSESASTRLSIGQAH